MTSDFGHTTRNSERWLTRSHSIFQCQWKYIVVTMCHVLEMPAVGICWVLLLVCVTRPALAADIQKRVYCTANTQEIYLNCSVNLLINVLSSSYGYQELPLDDASCQYQEVTDDKCPARALDKDMLHHCMGVTACNQPTKVPASDNCGQKINYFQVAFECIPDSRADPHSVIDICGDVTQGTDPPRLLGYIESLGYPDAYSPDTMCTCELSSTEPTAKIELTVLDVVLDDTSSDWLEYTDTKLHWATGHRLNLAQKGEVVHTGYTSLYLNFHSDSLREERGFWVKYLSNTDQGVSSTVQVKCGRFIPPDHKNQTACFLPPNKGELALSCSDVGIIKVNAVVQGYRADQPTGDDACTDVTSDTCKMYSRDNHDILGKCMGKASCLVPVASAPLPPDIAAKCGDGQNEYDTNYVQVRYECITDTIPSERHNMVDICGDSIGDATVRRSSGYVTSLNYPDEYPPDASCTCQLAVDAGAQILLYPMDVNMDDAECEKDWLHYRSGGTQSYGFGSPICIPTYGEPIFTDASVVYLDFRSNQATSGRGFWIEYIGRQVNGSSTDVQVQCSRNPLSPPTPVPSVPGGAGVDTASPMSTRYSNKGLIAGLTIVVLLMLAVALAMLIYKCRKSSVKAPQDGSPSGGEQTSPLEAGYNSIRHYSAFSSNKAAAPYATLQDDSSLGSSSLREGTPRQRSTFSGDAHFVPPAGTSSPKDEEGPYDVVHRPPREKTNTSSFINPAFDGTLGRNDDFPQQYQI